MQVIRNINPLARAIAVIASVMVLATGATYAAFVDSVTLTNNSFTTASATADLNIYNFTLGDWADTAPGFDFGELEIGEESARKDFYLQNVGNIPLYVTASIPDSEGAFNDINPDKVTFTFYGECTDEAETMGVSATMTELIAGEVDLPCDPLDAGATGVQGEEGNEANYQVSVTIDENATPPEADDDEENETFTLLFNGYSTDEETGGDPTPPITE